VVTQLYVDELKAEGDWEVLKNILVSIDDNAPKGSSYWI
jgi:hypothetical protein